MDHLLCQEWMGPLLLGLSPQTYRRHSVVLCEKDRLGINTMRFHQSDTVIFKQCVQFHKD